MTASSREIYGMAPSRPEEYSQQMIDVIRNRWDQKADRWDEDLQNPDFHLNEDNAYERFLDTAKTIVAHHRKACAKALLVDLGCGTAQVLNELIPFFGDGIGVDISEKMLERARGRNIPRTTFVCANCFDLSRVIGSARAIVSRGILLSHYGRSAAKELIGEVFNSLMPSGGFAVLDFLNKESRHLYSTPENKAFFSGQEVSTIARSVGFDKVVVLGSVERRNRIAYLERQS